MPARLLNQLLASAVIETYRKKGPGASVKSVHESMVATYGDRAPGERKTQEILQEFRGQVILRHRKIFKCHKSSIRHSIVDFYYISHFSSVGRAIVL